MREQGAVAFGLVWLAFVGLLTYALLGSVADQAEAGAFVPVQATVVDAEVRASNEGTSGASTRTFDPHITYRYEVGSDVLTSDRYHFAGLSSWTESSAAEVVRTHPPGTTIVAYVDPGDATRVVLDRSAPPVLSLGVLLSILAGAGVGLVGWGVRGLVTAPGELMERAEPATSP